MAITLFGYTFGKTEETVVYPLKTGECFRRDENTGVLLKCESYIDQDGSTSTLETVQPDQV